MELGMENFCCECSLVDDLIDTLIYIYKGRKEKYASVGVICDEDLTEDILKYACSNFDVSIDYLDFDRDDYYDSYGVIFSFEDDGLTLSVEKVESDGGYKYFELDYLYVQYGVEEALINRQLIGDMEVDLFLIEGNC